MGARVKPPCESGRAWLRARRGARCLALFTGGTSRAFSAYLHLVELWTHVRTEASVEALRLTVLHLQAKEWPLAAEVVAHFADWSDVEPLWRVIKAPGAPDYYCTDGGALLERGRRHYFDRLLKAVCRLENDPRADGEDEQDVRDALRAYENCGDHDHGAGPIPAGTPCPGGDCLVARARAAIQRRIALALAVTNKESH